jgi:hypothetical protein
MRMQDKSVMGKSVEILCGVRGEQESLTDFLTIFVGNLGRFVRNRQIADKHPPAWFLDLDMIYQKFRIVR